MREGRHPRIRKVRGDGHTRYGPAVRLTFILVLVLNASSVVAQPRYVRVEADAEGVREEARERGWASLEDVTDQTPLPSREEVADLSRVEALIAQAREAAARLREGEALHALTEARTLLERRARTPGVARWLAEVELATGVVAHQQGRNALAEQSLGRAASLDPSRRLGAAEAPPPVVRRAQELARAAATRPETELTIRSTARDARATLDDRALGSLPVSVEVGVGRHVLRIEAPGHRPWGRVVDLTEGRSRPWEITLSPSDAEARRRRIAAADLAGLPATLEGGASVLWVTPRNDRALVTRCTSLGCTEPRVRALDDVFVEEDDAVLDGERLASAWSEGLAALGRDPLGGEVPPPPREWWQKGSTWVAIALGAVVAGVALGFSLRPDVRQELRLVVGSDQLDEL